LGPEPFANDLGVVAGGPLDDDSGLQWREVLPEPSGAVRALDVIEPDKRRGDLQKDGTRELDQVGAHDAVRVAMRGKLGQAALNRSIEHIALVMTQRGAREQPTLQLPPRDVLGAIQ